MLDAQVPSKPKGKKILLQIIPVAILIASVTGALYFSGFFNDAIASPLGGVLSPTRNIEGTWKTTLPVSFNIATDYQNFGELENVGTEDRTMTWTITPTNEDNVVLITIEFSYSNRQLIDGSGYVPDTSFMQLRGIVNATQLTLTKGDSGPIKQVGSVGVFTFTSTQMEGTWHDHWNGVWEQNVYTSTNALKLMKQ